MSSPTGDHDRPCIHSRRGVFVAAALLVPFLGGAAAWQASVAPSGADAVAYPEGYRDWAHVKSTMVGPNHKRFESIGGFQHVYANPEAMVGYRTRRFPEGSIVVFDWLEMQDSGGAYREGARRQVDVMVKDSQRFAATGGWGFQRFVRDSRTERAAAPVPAQCFACHQRLKQDDLILSRYRQ